jgi:uncharacterized protein
MLASIPAWFNVALAMGGPAVVALAGARWSSASSGFSWHVLSLSAIVLIVLWVYVIAIRREGYTVLRLGFGKLSMWTPIQATTLTAFFILAFGPVAYWLVARIGAGGFEGGLAAANKLPTVYLIMTIILVASAEELLYRGYAIERLADLTGSYVLAGCISIVAFSLAHVPMWGWGPALTTVLSGGIMTIVYLWRQDVVALILAHIATDVYGIVLVPYFARQAGG